MPRHGTKRAYHLGCRCVLCKEHWNIYCRTKRTKESIRRNNLKQSHGLSVEDYEKKLKEQNGVCASCGQKETGRNQYGVLPLAVDHDHATGERRGLLCMRCNRALGLLGDNPTTVMRLLEYRTRYV